MTFVVDASVAIKWVVQEADSEAENQILTEVLIAPPLFRVECANVLWKLCQRAEISNEEAVSRLEELSWTGVEIVEVDPGAALWLALQLNHPVYDCTYLALAESRDTQLITADRRLQRAARATAWARRIRLLGPS